MVNVKSHKRKLKSGKIVGIKSYKRNSASRNQVLNKQFNKKREVMIQLTEVFRNVRDSTMSWQKKAKIYRIINEIRKDIKINSYDKAYNKLDELEQSMFYKDKHFDLLKENLRDLKRKR